LTKKKRKKKETHQNKNKQTLGKSQRWALYSGRENHSLTMPLHMSMIEVTENPLIFVEFHCRACGSEKKNDAGRSVQTTVSGADACQYSHMTSNKCHGEAQPPPRRVVASLTDDVADKRSCSKTLWRASARAR
jgi:hypothetical protein